MTSWHNIRTCEVHIFRQRIKLLGIGRLVFTLVRPNRTLHLICDGSRDRSRRSGTTAFPQERLVVFRIAQLDFNPRSAVHCGVPMFSKSVGHSCWAGEGDAEAGEKGREREGAMGERCLCGRQRCFSQR